MGDMNIKALARNLRYYREARELTRDELARKAGISPAAITRYEKAQRAAPSLVHIGRIATVLGVTTDELTDALDNFEESGIPFRQRLAEMERRLNDGLAEQFRRVRENALFYRYVGDWGADPRRGIDAPFDDEQDGFVVRVVGDCLVPDIMPGSAVLFLGDRPVAVNDIVAAIVNGERHIKRVIERNGEWVLADNNGQIVAAADGIDVRGVMVYKWRPEA
jgi:transcriptional regulator with XRE-family HTH domain